MIAAFDLEGTLTTGATWIGVARYLRSHGRAARYNLFYALHIPGALLVRAGLIQQKKYKVTWMVNLTRTLKGMTPYEIADMAEWVVEHEMWPQRREDVLTELKHLQDQGHDVIVASGTYIPIVEAFARRIGVHEVIGTPLVYQDNYAAGKLVLPMNFGTIKRDNLLRYLNGKNLQIAFGDTEDDIPMLAASREAVAVYPDEKLRKEARAQGWRIEGKRDAGYSH